MSTIFYGDARDNLLASSVDKQSNALGHFNYFLKTYCVQIGINIIEAAAIPYHGIPCQASNKAIFEFWDKMIGAFFSYMGTSAMCFLNPEGRRLAYQSATQYCSSIKVFITISSGTTPLSLSSNLNYEDSTQSSTMLLVQRL
jgi:hypothetical protein